ncbi:MAG: aldehyde dehydrogenase family protein, partial [Coxiellaceae bacterium]|nr:aldehyde dehydrogenase family protein [Coxiellaceae bacterium]
MAKAAKVLDFESEKFPDIDVINPHTGKVIYTMPCATPKEIAETFKRARVASEKLRKMSVKERLGHLRLLRDAIIRHQDEIVDHVCLETGKPKIDPLMAEVLGSLSIFDYYFNNAEKALADKIVKTPIQLMGKKSKVFYDPLGTVLVISPWNFPFAMMLLPTICALTAGNAVVIKPSEVTPLYGLFEKILEDSGVLENCIQVIYGGKETGALCVDARPDKIIFTGSPRGGSAVMQHAAKYLIPVELELGGKDPMVIFDDVDVERAADAALTGGLYHSGQICISIERLLVQDGIYDKFTNRLVEKMQKVKTPSKVQGTADQGFSDYAVITPEFQCDKIQEQLDDAVAKGATILTGGKRVNGTHEFEPT